jgi:hypothetical protein
MPHEAYQHGLTELTKAAPKERTTTLVETSARLLQHFFDREEYGTLEPHNPDIIPGAWPYVRYLMADALRPKFGYGEALFTQVEWNQKFLQDIHDEARQLTQLLPPDITQDEWFFIVDVSGYMLMENPFFLEQGLVSENGRGRLIARSLMATGARMEGKDMYEEHFLSWKIELTHSPEA